MHMHTLDTCHTPAMRTPVLHVQAPQLRRGFAVLLNQGQHIGPPSTILKKKRTRSERESHLYTQECPAPRPYLFEIGRHAARGADTLRVGEAQPRQRHFGG